MQNFKETANSEHVLHIAVGGRSLGKVTSKKIVWKDLLKNLSYAMTDSNTTTLQYSKMKSDDRASLKGAAGYFVGGPSIDGLRKKASFSERSVLCYDLDDLSVKVAKQLLGGNTTLRGIEHFVHTTRSHTPEKPKLRIVIPLKTSVIARVYEFLTWYFADKYFDKLSEINVVDPISHRIAQLMYYPTVCSDGEFLTYHGAGRLFEAFDLLSTIKDWSDPQNLPLKARSASKSSITGGLRDPRTKSGLIGAFCRSYDIEAAIENFLPEIYLKSDVSSNETRYTYALGSGNGGACVYDHNTYIYSNHSTDRLFQKCANSFDMVRIHLFGELDEDTSLPLIELNSYIEMCNFIKDDEAVLNELNQYNLERFLLALEGGENDIVSLDIFQEPVNRSIPQSMLHVLSPFWRSVVTNIVETTGSSEDFVFWSLMTSVSACIGNSRRLKINDAWSEPAILWTVLVGDPSVKKSPAFNSFIENLQKNDSKSRDEYETELENFNNMSKARQKNISKLEKQLATLADPEESIILEKAIKSLTSMHEEPKNYSFLVQDITFEALLRKAATSPRGLFFAKDELSSWFNGFGKYNASSDAERAAWLEGFTGKSVNIDRINLNKKSLKVPQFAVNILGTIQPDRLSKIYQSASDGLLERFLTIYCDTPSVKKPISRSNAKLPDISGVFQELLNLANSRDSMIVELDEDAFNLFSSWDMSKKEEDVPEALKAYFKKNLSHIPRFALILSYMDWAAENLFDETAPTSISAVYMQKAIDIWENNVKLHQTNTYIKCNKSPLEHQIKDMLNGFTVIKKVYFDEEQAFVEGKFTSQVALSKCLSYAEGKKWIRKIHVNDVETGKKKVNYEILFDLS